ncbi:MAG: hypothetical protein MRERC_5c039 [Mycoplasmataceae bacterium RC_NB112A]|nr:MAG: hypothetical protein MRERC_5c039 [Mycoplasmataceae bacterium RC_NB112A]
MKIEQKNGIKWISCDNLREVIKEFKKFRASQIASGKKRDWKDYFFLSTLRLKTVKTDKGMVALEEISEVPIYQQDGVDLSLNIASLNWKEKDWSPYDKKLKKILKEIWGIEEEKDYQGLDLNWPVRTIVRCNSCGKLIEKSKLAYFSDRDKDIDFCSESCYSKFFKQERNKQEKNKNNTPAIITFIAIGSILIAFTLLFFGWLKLRKKRTLKS